jgi:hypothetical protein
MGKLAITTYKSHWVLTRSLAGGFLFYSEDQLDAFSWKLSRAILIDDTKAAVLVFMAYSSSPVSSFMKISQLIEINEINGSWLPSDLIMMRLILPEYSTNS